MVKMLPDRTFYPSAALAAESPAEGLAYVALLAPESNGSTNGHSDAIGVVDVNPASAEYGKLVGKGLRFTGRGDTSAGGFVIDWTAKGFGAVATGVLDWLEVHELHEVVAGETQGRGGQRDIVVFKSNGIAVWDVAAGAEAVARARAAGVGRAL